MGQPIDMRSEKPAVSSSCIAATSIQDYLSIIQDEWGPVIVKIGGSKYQYEPIWEVAAKEFNDMLFIIGDEVGFWGKLILVLEVDI